MCRILEMNIGDQKIQIADIKVKGKAAGNGNFKSKTVPATFKIVIQ